MFFTLNIYQETHYTYYLVVRKRSFMHVITIFMVEFDRYKVFYR